MKQLFGFTLLIFVALMLLALIGGINSIFGSIATTWTVNQTASIADGFASVLYFGGIVFVSVLGYGLFLNMSKGGKGWSGSRPQQPDHYQVLPDYQQPRGMLPPPTEQGDWYELEQPEHEATYR